MNDKVKAVTPLGKCEWFSLSKVDKFGSYTTNLILEESPETLKFINQIDELLPEGTTPSYTKQSDGSFKIKLKVKSIGNKKDGSQYTINPPVIYNSMGKKVDGMELAQMVIGNGSELRAKVELRAYDFNGKKGVSIKPISVQLGKLVDIGSESTEDLGFAALSYESIEETVESAPKESYDF